MWVDDISRGQYGRLPVTILPLNSSRVKRGGRRRERSRDRKERSLSRKRSHKDQDRSRKARPVKVTEGFPEGRSLHCQPP